MGSETEKVVRVEMAQFRVGRAPVKMTTLALGSCVGITLYDQNVKVGGMAHAMHPRRDLVKNNLNKAKFVDCVVELMVRQMITKGASIKGIVAKLFGGARMFGHIANNRGVKQIGEKNVREAKEKLKNLKIPIVCEDVGGERGRTITFDLYDGSVYLRDVYGNQEIY